MCLNVGKEKEWYLAIAFGDSQATSTAKSANFRPGNHTAALVCWPSLKAIVRFYFFSFPTIGHMSRLEFSKIRKLTLKRYYYEWTQCASNQLLTSSHVAPDYSSFWSTTINDEFFHGSKLVFWILIVLSPISKLWIVILLTWVIYSCCRFLFSISPSFFLRCHPTW